MENRNINDHQTRHTYTQTHKYYITLTLTYTNIYTHKYTKLVLFCMENLQRISPNSLTTIKLGKKKQKTQMNMERKTGRIREI